MRTEDTSNTEASQPLAHNPIEAARLLGVSRATVDRLIASGELRAKRAGRRVLISEQALRDFLEDN